MTRILWISKHNVLPAQRQELKKIFGNNIEIVQYRDRIHDVDHVLFLIQYFRADKVVTVLPLTIIKRLCERGVKPIIAKMIEVNGENFNPDTDWIEPKTKKHFRFSHFEVVHEVKIVSSPLTPLLKGGVSK